MSAPTPQEEDDHYAILDTVAGEFTVMGYGDSPESAMADARVYADAEWNWAGCRYVELTAQRAARIVAGDNDASDLWDNACDASEYVAVAYSYTVYDGNPASSGSCEWPHMADVEFTAESMEAAVKHVRGVLEVKAAGLSRTDGYDVADRIYAMIWGEDSSETVSHELTEADLA